MSNTTLTPLRRFLNLLKVDRQEIGSIYVYALFNGIVSLSLPLGIQAIINLISTGQMSTTWIVLVAFVIAGVAFTGIMQIMQLTITENLQQKIFARSAFEFTYRIPRMKLEFVDKRYIPELVNRFFDTLSVQKGLSKILMDFSSASLQILFGLILLSFYHPFFIIFSLLLIIVVYIIFRYTIPRGLKTSLVESTFKYEVAHWLEELARTMETFKLAGKTPLPMDKTDEVVHGYLTSRKAHFRTLLVQYINLVGFKVIIAASLLIIGSLLVINEQMNIGQFVASEIIIILVLSSIEKLIVSVETIYDVLTSIEKIGSVTDIPLEYDGGSLETTTGKGMEVELRNLSYQFHDDSRPLLKNINLKIGPGEHLCLSGPNGSGKSMLLQLIAGLYDDFTGSLVYDNLPSGNWNRQTLRSAMGDNLAMGDIFRGSLIENLTLGKPWITMDNIKEVTAMLGIKEFIENMEDGYETLLLPLGKSLPTNVRLKIILARSVLCNPRLILLEDSFNRLRREDRESFLDYIFAPERNWTVIAVSNQKSIAKRFDKVAVVNNGEIEMLSDPSIVDSHPNFQLN